MLQEMKQILSYFKDNEDNFNDCLEELDNEIGYINDDDKFYPMEELEFMIDTSDLMTVLNMCYFGDDLDNWHYKGDRKIYDSFNPNREYFSFNGYGNLCSSNWKDYSTYITEETILKMLENRYDINGINDDEELSGLFDNLENALAA